MAGIPLSFPKTHNSLRNLRPCPTGVVKKKHGSTVDLTWFHKDFTFAHLKCTVDPVNPSTQVEATCSMSRSKLGDLPGRVDVGSLLVHISINHIYPISIDGKVENILSN